MANIYRSFPGDITRVHGIRVGQAQNTQAMTGVTVVLPQAEGAVGGVSVRGAAPGTRETDLLRPGNLVERAPPRWCCPAAAPMAWPPRTA